jgi:hypothetical protein
MKTSNLAFGMGILFLAAATGAARAQKADAEPVIEPEAGVVLRQLSDHIKQVQSVILHIADTIDEVQPDGSKLQFAHVRVLTVQRPDKLKVETTGDVSCRTFWKDGKTLTVLDSDKNVYAQIPDPGTIEEAIDLLQSKYNMSLPASDMLSGDFYQTMTNGCRSIDYVGIGYVGEEKCHHLAFSRDIIDWQMWIGMGDKPSIRKMVITYKQLPGQPQYTLQLLRTETPARITESAFTAEIPKTAMKIEIKTAEKAK